MISSTKEAFPNPVYGADRWQVGWGRPQDDRRGAFVTWSRLTVNLFDYFLLNMVGKPKETFELSEVVERLLPPVGCTCDGVWFEIQKGKLPRLEGNAGQMGRFMQTLLENAARSFGRNCPIVRITAHRGLQGWIVSVADNGMGLHFDDHEEIFKIFKRPGIARAYELPDTGLAWCRRVAELHGGNLWVTSALGLGTIFSFSIPDSLVTSQLPEA